MPSADDIKRQQTLLATYRRTLGILLEQRAAHGAAYAPPATISGIIEARGQIAQIKGVLRGWGVAVDDDPNDAEATVAEQLAQPERPIAPTYIFNAPLNAGKDTKNLEKKHYYILIGTFLLAILAFVIIQISSNLPSNVNGELIQAEPEISSTSTITTIPDKITNFTPTTVSTPLASTPASTQTWEDIAIAGGNPQRTRVYGTQSVRSGRQIKWTQPTTGTVETAPVVIGGVAYFGDRIVSENGYVYAVDIQTGKPKWTVEVGGPVLASLAVADGVIYVYVSNSGLYALDSETGVEQWRFELGEQDVYGAPLIIDGVIFFGTNGGYLYAIDLQTHQEHWPAVKLDGSLISDPAVQNGLIYVVSTNDQAKQASVYAIEMATGKINWSFAREGEVMRGPAVVGDMLYITSNAGFVYIVDAQTGKQQEPLPFTSAVVEGVTHPAVLDNVVYVGATDGLLYAVDIGTRQVRSFQAAGGIRSTPAIAGSVLYVVSNGILYGIDTGKMTEVSQLKLTEAVEQRVDPSIAEGVVYVGGLGRTSAIE